MARKDQEAFRMECVSRARVFKRSWVEMAEALVTVRNDGLYDKWGYDSIHSYANDELHIKKATVDKLTGSFYALEQYVPHVLAWDGVAQQLPEVEVVDYFAKAVDPPRKKDGEQPKAPSEDVVSELKRAIFDDHTSAAALKRRVDPILHPKSDDELRLQILARAEASARALEGIVVGIDGLSEERVEQVTSALEELRKDLDALE